MPLCDSTDYVKSHQEQHLEAFWEQEQLVKQGKKGK